jgi:hypothetical protein
MPRSKTPQTGAAALTAKNQPSSGQITKKRASKRLKGGEDPLQALLHRVQASVSPQAEGVSVVKSVKKKVYSKEGEGGRRKEEGGRRKEEGGRRKEDKEDRKTGGRR